MTKARFPLYQMNLISTSTINCLLISVYLRFDGVEINTCNAQSVYNSYIRDLSELNRIRL